MDNSVYIYRDFLNDKANISGRNRTEVYALAYSFRSEKLIVFTNIILFFLSALTLFMLWMIYKCVEIRRIFALIGLDLKILLSLGFSAYMIGALNSMLFFGYQSLILLMNFRLSFYIWSGKHCFLAQVLFISSTPSIYLLVYIATFIERLYASMGFRERGIFGTIASFIILVFSLVVQYVVIYPETYVNERVYCGKLLTTFYSNTTSSLFAAIAFDCLISALDYGLLRLNKRKIQDYK